MPNDLRTMAALALAAALSGLLAGCAASGPIRAVETADGGAKPVVMSYRTERFGLNGMLTATMPDGEQYSGRYLQVTSDTEADTLLPFWAGWDVGWGDWGPWADDTPDYMVGADMPTFVRNYSGKAIATLLGDRGGRMRCRFHLADPTEGMEGGGLGQCETDKKVKIDATF